MLSTDVSQTFRTLVHVDVQRDGDFGQGQAFEVAQHQDPGGLVQAHLSLPGEWAVWIAPGGEHAAGYQVVGGHVEERLGQCAYRAISPKAAPGVDGETWAAYGQVLEASLQDLHTRVHAGRYRAKPSRRAYIPKVDGRQRPLGIATVEDKILQRAVVEVLNADR